MEKHRISDVVKVLLFLLAGPVLLAGQTSVTTYHYNNYRTGWNSTETWLTPTSVASFGLITAVSLDEQVDAQPLYVPAVTFTLGNITTKRDIVYLATENNTVYAIDAHTGEYLLSQNFGTPVPKSSLPSNCGNNGPNVGITSTPAIDLTTNTLYVMSYTDDGPTYRLHALDLSTLAEKANSPVVVTASHPLYPAGTFLFNAQYQRQRPALLLANSNVYVGFGSFCDKAENLSRGWLLGWTALTSTGGSLQLLPANVLLDSQETDTDDYFLASLWMSGYGPAADDSGNVLFVTGNSQGSAYTGTTDIQESVVKVSPFLTSILGLFTPDTVESLDDGDTDFGAGGVLVLPDQPGAVPHMAVAAGKDGNMYLMNEDHLGGFSSTTNNVLGTYSIGNCWCGQSYYVDPTDGLARVVTSGGTGNPIDGPALANTLEVWKVQTSPSAALIQVGSAQLGPSAQGPGFFTSISSNGTANPIIWALSRPQNSNPATINLFAFNPDAGLKELVNVSAGTWPNTGGNANLVPVVANGEVFVASNKQLQIFGVPSFWLSATHSQTAAAGSSAVYGIGYNAVLGFPSNVTLSVTGLPAGATGIFNPTTVGGSVVSSALTVSPSTSTPLGTYSLTITGTSGSHTYSVAVILVVTFPLSITPSSQNVGQGSTVFYTVTVPPVGGYKGNISLQVSGGLGGCFPSCPYTITGGSGSTSLYVSTTSSTTEETYTETVTGTSGSLSQTAAVTTVVDPAYYSLSLSPIQQNTAAGQNTNFTVTISASLCAKFKSQVTLAFSNFGNPLTGTFNPTSITGCGSSTLTVGNTASGPGGIYFLVTGSSSQYNETNSVQGEVVITN